MNQICIGDCRDIMRRWISEGVRAQICVCSPPYWGLRNYGVPPLIWGGAETCEHQWGDLLPPKPGRGNKPGDISTSSLTNPGRQDTLPRASDSGSLCQRCGAWRGALGLEPTPEMYVANMVEVFRLVREVLADDGTLWLNMGDSYAGSGRGGHVGNSSTLEGSIDHEQECQKARGSQLAPGLHAAAAGGVIGRAWVPPPNGLKQKDLVGIPWMVAFALRADGWYLRQDIIWSKPNPMPESVRDRCTKAHEYLFLLAKRDRYYYDADAVAEASVYPGDNRALRTDTRKLVDVMCMDNGSRARTGNPTGETRNKRSVWIVATQPYSEAHFATFPPELIKPCILAGSRPGDIVFDPFIGSGTIAKVALELGRQYLGCELNPKYAALSVDRIKTTAGLPFFSDSAPIITRALAP